MYLDVTNEQTVSIGMKVLFIATLVYSAFTVAMYYKEIVGCTRSCVQLTKEVDAQPQWLMLALTNAVIFFWYVPVVAYIDHRHVAYYVSHSIIDIQICLIPYLLKMAAKGLLKEIKSVYNYLVEDVVDHPTLYHDEPCFTKVVKQSSFSPVYRLRQIYIQLYDNMCTMNQCFAVPALCIMLFSRFLFAVFLYRWIIKKFSYPELLFAWVNIQHLFYICHRLEDLRAEVLKIVHLLDVTDLEPLDTRMRIEYKFFMIQLQKFKMDFSPFQWFVMEYALLISIFMETMTYLLILRQLSSS